MKPIENFDKIQASGDFEKLPAGGYVIRITDVEDRPADDKQYLLITYDIAEGEYADHFRNTDAEFVFSHQFIRSYKEKALGMFKAFVNAVEASNAGFKWDWKESKLRGKILGVVLGEEEYENNRGEVKVGLKVKACKPADAIRNGDFKVPELKKLPEQSGSAIPDGFQALADDSLPF